MNCANHPDMAALATCATCGKPLCPICARFYQGRVYCDEHLATATEQSVATGPISGAGVGMGGATSAIPPGLGAPPPAPAPTLPLGPGPAPLPPANVPQGTLLPGGPLIGADARLEPLPMSQRPGWSEETLVKPASGAETYGQIALALGLVSIVTAFCCSLIGWIFSLGAIVLGILALANAKTARDPQQARTFGTIGLILGLLSLFGSLALFAVFTAGSFMSGFP
jgi:hypothetical protein